MNYLSFAATWALFFASQQSYDKSHFWEVLPFVVAFFVLFSTMTFLYKIVNESKSNLLDLIALLGECRRVLCRWLAADRRGCMDGVGWRR